MYDDFVRKVMQKMGVDHTRARLTFTCRFLSVIGFQVLKFMPFEISDDERLQVILEMESKNTAINSLDIYVDIENIPDTHQTINAWIGPYTSLLTQEVENSNTSLQWFLPSTSTSLQHNFGERSEASQFDQASFQNVVQELFFS